MESFIPYAQHHLEEEDIEAILAVLRSNQLTRGPKVEEFEEELKKVVDAPYAVAFNSGTAALQAAYYAAEGGSQDKILSTPNTFISTVGAGSQRGMTPVFVDIDLNTGNLDLEQTLLNTDSPTSRGRTFVVPVHFTGLAVDMKKLSEEIKNPATVLIEDAAHAVGSLYPSGEKVGSCAYSDMTMFSFHPAKTFTMGEGGAVTTVHAEYYERLKTFRNNGISRAKPLLRGDPAPWYYEVHDLTGNYNVMDIQAALGLSQIKRLETFVKWRRKLVKLYRECLGHVEGIRLFTDAQDDYTAFHLFVVQIDFKKFKTSRTQVMERLKERGIGTQYHYVPLYRHPVYADHTPDLSEYFPNMEQYYAQGLSLPLYNTLKEEQVEKVCRELLSVFK